MTKMSGLTLRGYINSVTMSTRRVKNVVAPSLQKQSARRTPPPARRHINFEKPMAE